MEKDANYFVVGVFVTISLVAVVGFVIWLAGTHNTGDVNRYTVYFTDSVTGLNESALVKYKGVDVGKVTGMRLSPDRSDLVKVDIEVKDSTPVRAGTQAKIQMQGVTGQSVIELATATTDSTPPTQMPDEKYPVLKGSGSALGKFFDDLPRISGQVQTTLGGVDEFSRSGAKMMDSLNGLAEKLKEDPSQIIRGPSHKGVEIPK